MLGARPAETPMDSNVKFEAEQGELCSDPGRYRRLVGKLIYLTVTRPDIAFAIGVVSQFMHAPRQPHWEAVCRILRYLKNAPGKGLIGRLIALILKDFLMLIGLETMMIEDRLPVLVIRW